MDSYALYNYKYCASGTAQDDLFISREIKVDMSTEDKNLWLDRLFGDRNADVRILHMKKNGAGGDTFPCKVLAHSGRVVWLRLENEKIRQLWVKHQSSTPHEPDPISQEFIADNPFTYIFLDCREGKNLIAIKKENDAWRNTDVAARLVEESLNLMMQKYGYGFDMVIEPETVTKDFWDYNRQLILKNKLKVKKMTIYFGAGILNPKLIELINQIPILKRLQKEMWDAKRGKLELENPLGARIVDKRKRDFKNIIELIGSNLTSDAFGLSISYDDGPEVVCGKDVSLIYPMKTDTFSMLFSVNLFGEYRINEWLDSAVEYIKQQKNGTLAYNNRKRKTPKHVQDTSSLFDLF